MDYRLEPLGPKHRLDVAHIYNVHATTGFAAYSEETVDEGFYDLLKGMIRHFPAFAVASPGEDIVGFSYMRPYSYIPALSRLARLTYFLLPEHTRHGVGATLLDRFEESAPLLGVDALIADVCSLNEASLSFHKRRGFSEAGRFARAGRKFGRDFDIVWMQKNLAPVHPRDPD